MTIESIIARLPKSIVSELSEVDIKIWIKDALKLLPGASLFDKIQIIDVVDGKYKLPDDFVQLTNLFWQVKPLTQEMCTEFKCEPYELREQVCKPMVYHTIFLNSVFYKDCFKPIKYVGRDKSLLCKDCLTSDCSETFIITPERMLYTSFDEGTLCLHYKTNILDGEFFIEENQTITDFLVSYVSKKYWEERLFNKEEGVAQIYDRFTQQTDILLRRAKGSINMRNVNSDQVNHVIFGSLNNTLKRNEELRKSETYFNRRFK